MRKLYALITCPASDSPKPKVIQVSFDKEGLEEIADYLNQFIHSMPNATVREVDEGICDRYWPR